MREETEAAGGGKGRGCQSSAFPFLFWWNTQIPPAQATPHYCYIQWVVAPGSLGH